MAKVERMAGEVRRELERHADAGRVKKYARYFKEGFDAYGVEAKTLFALRDGWLEAWKELGLEGFVKLGDVLVKSGKYEEGSLAILFVAAHRSEFTAGVLERLGRWLEEGGLRNWAHTDVFSQEVLTHFLKDGIVGLEAIAEWPASASRWKRRAAAVMLIKTGLKAGPVLTFVEPMMEDGERVVQQGMGWLLREVWKKEPAAVEKLLLAHKETAPRLMIQYATEKMPAEGKARFKRTAKGAKVRLRAEA